MRSAREALGLEGRVLVHAGPERLDGASLPPPMRNSALLSCIHEGWAASQQHDLAWVLRRDASQAPRASATPIDLMRHKLMSVVEEMGEGVTSINRGDRVYVHASLTGTYAQKALCNESHVQSGLG